MSARKVNFGEKTQLADAVRMRGNRAQVEARYLAEKTCSDDVSLNVTSRAGKGYRAKAASFPILSDVFASSVPNSSIKVATTPVHPVWWLAPSPAPFSPWKYS